jgi:hypothetical protein
MRMLEAKTRATFLIALAQLCFGVSSRAQDIGAGAIVIRDTDHSGMAPVYAHAEGDRVEALAGHGDGVVGITVMGLLNHVYSFESSNGRVHVAYFANKEQIGIQRTAWMDPKDLDNFTYDCSCGLREFHGIKAEECSPFAKAGFVKRKWNECFLQARDQKTAEMEGRQRESPGGEPVPGSATLSNGSPPPGGDASDEKPLSADDILKATSAGAVGDASTEPETKSQASSGPTAPPGAVDKHLSKPFTNKDVIALVKAGLGDKIVIDKIRSMPGDNLDTSTEALIHLKKVGVSKAVIDAVLKQTTAQ